MMDGTKTKSVNTKMTERQELSLWSQRVETGEDFAKKNFYERAKRYGKIFSGDHFTLGDDDGDKSDVLVINYVWSIIKSMIPQVYYQDPYFFLTANEEAGLGNKQLAEDYGNFCYRSMEIKKQMIRIILDWFVLGYGIGKLGYSTERVRNDNLETNKEYSYLVKDEYPYFLRQSPLDVVLDPEAKHIDDIRWLAVKYSVPLKELKERDSLKYKGIDDIEGKSTTEVKSKGENTQDEDLKRVKIWEIEDFVENRIMTYTDENKSEFLKKVSNPYYEKCDIKSNYLFLFNNIVPDKLYPQSEVTNLEKPNREYNKTRTQIMNHRAKSQRKIVYEQGTFTSAEELEKFLDDIDLQPCEVIREGTNKIAVFSASTLDGNLYNFCDAILFDMNNMSRQGFNQRAVESNTEKTATEANIIEKNANLGNAERLDIVTDYTEKLFRNLLAILQKFPSKAQEFFVESREVWQEFKKENIAGNFGVRIEAGSMVKRDSDADRGRSLQIFQTLVNLTDVDPNTGREKLLTNRTVLAKKLMEKFGLSEDEIMSVLAVAQPPKPQPPVQAPNPSVGGGAGY